MTPDFAGEISLQLIIVLAVVFLFVAMLYSSVGLGGGSTYIAIMTIAGINFVLIPSISLTLNLFVTFIGIINFGRNGYINVKIIFPFLITSIPMAYIGGALNLPRNIFLWILLITLLVVILRIYMFKDLAFRIKLSGVQRIIVSLILGSLLGFIAGTVGIGGGIYLVPLLIMFAIAGEKEAAAAGAVFIWVNSLSGLVARYQRGAFDFNIIIPLIITVIIGGFIGSYIGSFKFKPRSVQKILGIIVIIAIVFIVQKLIEV